MDGWCFRSLLSSRLVGLRGTLRATSVGIVLLASTLGSTWLPAQEAEWIWSPDHRHEAVPNGTCHFRKSFTVRRPEAGEIIIASDDTYELYLNNRKLGSGRGTDHLDKYNVGPYLNRGRNVIAIKVENREGATAALVARVHVKETGGEWQSFSTNASWKASLRALPLWTLPVYNDRGWKAAQSFGKLGTTAPWDRGEDVAVTGQTEHKRFQISQEFEVKRLLDDEATGSLIAMAFNEFGQVIVSQEGGPLMLIDDPAKPTEMVEYCGLVSSCQGILPLNGDVFVTGDGPDGLGLYRLTDTNRDGTLEDAEVIVPFDGNPGEHGPHGITLGPDGMIYVVVGNHSAAGVDYSESSPHRNYYEGDTVTPKYEDPGGHAAGVKVPGGVILRCTLDGSKVELFAGGLRNAYDIAFNNNGDLFVHDSDMESDMGTSWYRPTRLYQVVPGGDYGWRSGWSKFPEYYLDNLPPLVDTGRGSPTGAVVYDHVMFPTRFHGAVFLGDWSEGRILAVKTKRNGSTLTGNSEVFLQGSPLNVTDLDVGPDGALYFCTGGRGTSGGLYRISWKGDVPDVIKNIPENLTGVIRQPQIQSAWARQKVAAIKLELGATWANQLRGVAVSQNNPPNYRVRALDLMQLFGPQPDVTLLSRLHTDNNEDVRAKTAALLGLINTEESIELLTEMLADDDRNVRRIACQSLARLDATPSLDSIKRLLVSDDRFEVWAARRLLERIPTDEWKDEVIESENHRLFVQGSLALMIVEPSKRNAYEVLARTSGIMRGFVSDRNFVDMLRVTQLALVRGEVDPVDIPAFCEDMANEFPSGNALMNREIARILAYLDVADIGDRYVDYLESDTVSEVDKVHLGMYLPFIDAEWTSEQRLRVIKYLEAARVQEGGGSYEHYVMKACRDFAQRIQKEDVDEIMANGHLWPNAALVAFYKLPQELDANTIRTLKRIDVQIRDEDDDSFNQLKIGIVALLARNGDADSFDYLREIWHRDPERRSTIAIGLAEQPEGENWHLLVSSLPTLDERSAAPVLKSLLKVEQRPADAEYYRQVVLIGLRLGEATAADSIELLRYWTGEQVSLEGDDWETRLKAWQEWFASNHPDQPKAELPTSTGESKYEFDELFEYLESDEARLGDVTAGAEVFVKATCAKCHRFDNQGENVGPDLSKVARRFTRREILESIIYPSHVISDQYASRSVSTISGRQYAGMLAKNGRGDYVVIQSDGERVTIPEDDIDEIVHNPVSSMPAGTLDELTLEEIADLFAYLGAARKPRVAQRREQLRRE